MLFNYYLSVENCGFESHQRAINVEPLFLSRLLCDYPLPGQF